MAESEALAAEGLNEADEDEGDPLLLYARLAGDLPEIFKKDSASCFRSHPKFLLMGTVKGWLHVFDLEGNEVFKVCIHTGPVNDVSIDERGDYVATCSDDGTVVVTNICSRTHTKYNFGKPIQAVAFAVDFESMKREKKSSFDRFGVASGGLEGKLTITTKGLLSPTNNTIHQGEGAIHCIQWNGPFLAWANNQGIKVYDFARKRGLTYIARKSLDVDKVPVNEENYRACLAWGPRKDQDPYRSSSLVVGWGDSVTVAVGVNPKQSPRTRKSLSARAAHYQRGVPSATSASYNNDFYFQVIANFRTDFLICGIGFFNEQLDLILLGTAPKKRKPGRRKNSDEEPDLLEVRVVSTDGRVELCSDALPASTINDSKQLTQPSNYRLAVPMLTDGDDPFYILCPKDILVLSPIRNANTVSSLPFPSEVPFPTDEKGMEVEPPMEDDTYGGHYQGEEEDDEELDDEARRELEREKQEIEREDEEEEQKEVDEAGNIVEEDQDGNMHLRDSQFQEAIETATGAPRSPPKHLAPTTKVIPVVASPPHTPVHVSPPQPVEDILNTPVVTAEELLQKARDFLLADRQERLGGALEPTEILDPEQFIQVDAEEKMGIRRPVSPVSPSPPHSPLSDSFTRNEHSSPSVERRSLSAELERRASFPDMSSLPSSSSSTESSSTSSTTTGISSETQPRLSSSEPSLSSPPLTLEPEAISSTATTTTTLLTSTESEPTTQVVEETQAGISHDKLEEQAVEPVNASSSPALEPQTEPVLPDDSATPSAALTESLQQPAEEDEARIHISRESYDFTSLPPLPEGLAEGALFQRHLTDGTLQDPNGGFEGAAFPPFEGGALFDRQPTLQSPHGEGFEQPQDMLGDEPPADISLSLSRQATLLDAHGRPIVPEYGDPEEKTNEQSQDPSISISNPDPVGAETGLQESILGATAQESIPESQVREED